METMSEHMNEQRIIMTTMDMGPTSLAKVMLDWEEAYRREQCLRAVIEKSVLHLGKTQNVGNVRASYYRGRKTYDYERVGKDAPEEVIQRHEIVRIDWKAVCEDAGVSIDEVPYSQSEPGVTVKLV
uniref:Uncharacterized protein n=1 Tax=viral metagenome TaxID=1070528 RepID=A0A6M3K767_9ZZZZ